MHKLSFLLIATLAGIFASPYDELETVLNYDCQSLMSKEDKQMLTKLIFKHRVHTVIEVGSWMGASTMHIARMLPKHGVVYAVDTWKGSTEHQDNPCFTSYLPALYEQFLSNIIHTKLTDKVIPVQMTSLEAAKKLQGQVKPELIYIDAGHEEESVYEDLNAWYPYLDEGGILCGDDWEWVHPKQGYCSVQAAVRRFAKERGLKVCNRGYFWWCPPKK